MINNSITDNHKRLEYIPLTPIYFSINKLLLFQRFFGTYNDYEAEEKDAITSIVILSSVKDLA